MTRVTNTGTVREPGLNNWDMGLQKAFRPFGEDRELQFRADAFNALSHTQWSGFNTYDDRTILGSPNSSSQFGWVNGARPHRTLQLSLKFKF